MRHQVEKLQTHQPDKYVPPQGNMDTMTSYAKEYVGK